MRAIVCGVLLLASAGLCGCPAQVCSTDSPCGADETCREGVCEPTSTGDGGTAGNACGGPSGRAPNLVTNSGFECGTRDWSVYPEGVASLTTTSTNPKSGSMSLVITQTQSFKLIQVLSNSVTIQGPTTVCARAWMRGTAQNGHLAINHGPPNGKGIEDTFSSPITENEWVLNRPSQPLKAEIAGTESVTLKLIMKDAQVNQTLIVDDVQMWVSSDGSCSERQ